MWRSPSSAALTAHTTKRRPDSPPSPPPPLPPPPFKVAPPTAPTPSATAQPKRQEAGPTFEGHVEGEESKRSAQAQLSADATEPGEPNGAEALASVRKSAQFEGRNKALTAKEPRAGAGAFPQCHVITVRLACWQFRSTDLGRQVSMG